MSFTLNSSVFLSGAVFKGLRIPVPSGIAMLVGDPKAGGEGLRELLDVLRVVAGDLDHGVELEGGLERLYPR